MFVGCVLAPPCGQKLRVHRKKTKTAEGRREKMKWGTREEKEKRRFLQFRGSFQCGSTDQSETPLHLIFKSDWTRPSDSEHVFVSPLNIQPHCISPRQPIRGVLSVNHAPPVLRSGCVGHIINHQIHDWSLFLEQKLSTLHLRIY